MVATGPGLFTSSKPEDRRVVPDEPVTFRDSAVALARKRLSFTDSRACESQERYV